MINEDREDMQRRTKTDEDKTKTDKDKTKTDEDKMKRESGKKKNKRKEEHRPFFRTATSFCEQSWQSLIAAGHTCCGW